MPLCGGCEGRGYGFFFLVALFLLRVVCVRLFVVSVRALLSWLPVSVVSFSILSLQVLSLFVNIVVLVHVVVNVVVGGVDVAVFANVTDVGKLALGVVWLTLVAVHDGCGGGVLLLLLSLLFLLMMLLLSLFNCYALSQCSLLSALPVLLLF